MHEKGFKLDDVRKLITRYEFDGIEAIYYYFAKSQGDRLIDETTPFMDMARDLKLAVTGGSDFHGRSGSIGNYMELGFTEDVPVLPTTITLGAIQQIAASRQSLAR